MKARAIRDLAQLNEDEALGEVAAGLELLSENALHLCDEAHKLWEAQSWQSSGILAGIAAEEAAKFLILVDSVRCPRRADPERFGRQLGYFSSHLAKGIYIESCEWRPARFGEVVAYVNEDLREFYLDGPNDVDWIFRNEIERRREELMYVDYIETDDGHYWTAPRREESFSIWIERRVIALVRAMSTAGFARQEALRSIAAIWQPVEMHDDFHWSDLRELNATTVSRIRESRLSQADEETIVDLWPFPLHSLTLTRTPVAKRVLRESQRRQLEWIEEGV